MVLLIVVLLFILLLIGVPVFLSLGISSFVYLIFFADVAAEVGMQRIFGGLDNFAIMAMPLFILAAHAMDKGGLSDRILLWARNLVGHLPGGTALTTQVASMFFGALSGSSPATVAAVGRTLYPELVRQN